MKKAALGTRYLLGAIFLVFGLNGFLNFIPQPQPSPEAGAFLGALFKSGYFFPILKITEIIAGALLLANLFVPLALILLAPITLQILFFHVFLDASGLPIGIAVVALNAFLGYSYRDSYEKILTPKSELTA